jgi:uncharacterized membrane protein YeaQ/YmgE (transglycosylase-associated protein family)
MGIIWTILIGFVVGALAKLAYPGRQGFGIVVTTLLGIAGSFVATFLGQALGLYQAGEPAGFIGAIIGAILIIFIYGKLRPAAA